MRRRSLPPAGFLSVRTGSGSTGILQSPDPRIMLETILLSMGAIALSEIGDKTQLLALALAAHYRKPIPIVLGILCATLLNHWLAAMLGYWINAWLTPEILRWVLIVSFIGMGIWMMIPDKDDIDAEHSRWKKYGVFTATLILFFLAEMGDKTQLATIAIAAKVPEFPIYLYIAGFRRQFSSPSRSKTSLWRPKISPSQTFPVDEL